MWLKLFTTAMLIAGFTLLVAWPWAVGPKPLLGAPHSAYRQYGKRSTIYMSGLLITFAGSGLGAYLLLRRVREEYRDSMQENLESLIEGTLDDHGRGGNLPDGP